jgi:Transglutaminase-like superfamily
MSRIARLIALSRDQWRLVLQASILVIGIRVALFAVPFTLLRDALRRLAAGGSRQHANPAPKDRALVLWAVEAVGSRLPSFGTCLTQALTAHVLLGRIGQPSDLRIGVRRDAEGKFAGHAWLEHEGVVLIGGNCHSSYAPMPVLRGLERRS